MQSKLWGFLWTGVWLIAQRNPYPLLGVILATKGTHNYEYCPENWLFKARTIIHVVILAYHLSGMRMNLHEKTHL